MGKQPRVCSPNCHLPPPPKAALRADRFLCNSLPWIPLSPTAHPHRHRMLSGQEGRRGGLCGGRASLKGPVAAGAPWSARGRTGTSPSSEGVGRSEGCRVERTDGTCSHPGPRTLRQAVAHTGAAPRCRSSLDLSLVVCHPGSRPQGCPGPSALL